MHNPCHGFFLLLAFMCSTALLEAVEDCILNPALRKDTEVTEVDIDDEHALLQLGRTSSSAASIGDIRHTAEDSEAFFFGDRSLEAFREKARNASSSKTRPREIVWIDAFARTGSSLVLDLVRNSASNESDVFALFEPCHSGDRLSPELEAEGCSGLLRQLSLCNFSQIEGLYGWSNEHTTNAGQRYSKELATNLCMNASLIALKTITFYHRLNETVVWYLDQLPTLRIVTVVRDPRSAYASQRGLQNSLHGRFGAHGVDTMFDMCDAYAQNANISHPHLLHVLYEELVNDPHKVTIKLQKFLGRPVNEKQAQFVAENFDSDCADSDKPYSTCRTNSSSSLERFKDELDNNELAAFMAHDTCRETCEDYGYDCFYYRPFIESGLASDVICIATISVLIVALICVSCRLYYK